MILPISEGVFLVQEQLTENNVLDMRHLGSTCQNMLNQISREIILNVDKKPV